MIRLLAERVTVRRGDRVILQNVSFTSADGFVAVLGPNGAGKSTLLACLAGLITPDSGAVWLDGLQIQQLGGRGLAQRRAYLPQTPRAEWPISVERLIALGLIPKLPPFGGLPDQMMSQVDAAIAEADLDGRRDQPVTTLSGGELARAMLARALVDRPGLVIADEPLAGLDPRHAIDGAKRLRKLADRGTLVIASLHDLTLAARHATEVVVLRDGCLMASGPVGETLTSDLIQAAFDVSAEVRRAGDFSASVIWT